MIRRSVPLQKGNRHGERPFPAPLQKGNGHGERPFPVPLENGNKYAGQHFPMGFTLIEISIVMAVLSILILSLYTVFKSGQDSWRRAESRLIMYQSARAALDLMAQDLEKAVVNDWGNSYRNNFIGFNNPSGWRSNGKQNTDELYFMMPKKDLQDGGLCELGYWLRDDNYLMRFYVTDSATSFDRQFNTGRSNQVTDNISDLQVRYSDGTNWLNSWDTRSGGANAGNLPKAVEITITITPQNKSFTRIVNLRTY